MRNNGDDIKITYTKPIHNIAYGVSSKQDYINIILKPYLDKLLISIEHKIIEWYPNYIIKPYISIKYHHDEGLNYICILLKDIIFEKSKFNELQEYINSLSGMDIIYTHYTNLNGIKYTYNPVINIINIRNKNLDALYHKIGGIK